MQLEINQHKIDIAHSREKPENLPVDAAFIFLEEKSQDIGKIAKRLGVALSKAEFNGKFATYIALPNAKSRARNVILVGIGEKNKITTETLRRAASIAAAAAKTAGYKSVALGTEGLPFETHRAAHPLSEGFFLGLYSFDKYKSKKELFLNKATFCSGQDLQQALLTSTMLSEAVILVRNLGNAPASDMTPRIFAAVAKKQAVKYNIKIRIIGSRQAKKMGLNAFLAVARGSMEEPQFIIMEWNPKAAPTVALVGKGITFDSGGLNIKPADYMLGMHEDMEGAATVLAAIVAAARAKLPLHVVAVMPMTENMPSGSSYKPADIIRAYSGKTMEIINTDAEGRVVLSDALAYAEKNYKPDAIIDLATLTGACVVALGHEAAALIGNNEMLIEKIKAAASAVDERVWQLPLWDDYKELVKSDVADVRNIGKEKGSAGVIAGAAFLDAFVSKTPWAHLDIAGVTIYERNRYYMAKGSTGWGVRLLYRLLKDWSTR